MIALLQRVSEAGIAVQGEQIAAIGRGVVALVAVEQGDGDAEAERMAERILGFRLFADGQGRMNLDIAAVGGELLVVPQFTLAAATDSGHRPSFSGSAPPEEAHRLFDALVGAIRATGQAVVTGRFGANMQVSLVNDGPVTFSLRVKPPGA